MNAVEEAFRGGSKDPPAVIYGVNPLREALLANPGEIRQIYVAPGDEKGHRLRKVLEAAARASIPVSGAARSRLSKLAGTEHHQGIVGLIRPYAYADLEELLQLPRKENLSGQVVVVLDGVTDPQNLGAIVRSAHCFGATGVIIPQDRTASVTPAVGKASAGAVYHLPVARVGNLSRALDRLKEAGFWVYGAAAEAGVGHDVRSLDLAGRIALVMGSEGRGLRELIRKKCDFFLCIPMIGKLDSLNVSVAAGVLLHDIFRKLWVHRGKEG